MPLSDELLGQLLLNFRDPAFAASGERFEPLGNDFVGVRIEFAEREVLKLLAHFLHAHAARKRRIDIERLFGRQPARLRRPMRQRPHVVQPVGELDQQHAHVVGDGKQKLAQIFGLLRLLGDEIELLQLGQALDQNADVMAKQAIDLGAGGVGILDRVVQERRRNGGVVELEIGEDGGDLKRVGEIWIAGVAFLRAMRPHGIDISAVEQILVGRGIVLFDPVDEFELPHQSRLARLRHPRLVLRHEARAVRYRDPRPGLVLHPRQIDRRARHHKPRPPPKLFGGGTQKDIMAPATSYKPSDRRRRDTNLAAVHKLSVNGRGRSLLPLRGSALATATASPARYRSLRPMAAAHPRSPR